jgi:alkylated DNA repair dioxygenase AlkB
VDADAAYTTDLVYGYGRRLAPAKCMPSWVKQLGLDTANRVGISIPQKKILSCNANLYVDGKAGLKLHADDEPLFYESADDKVNIVSFSVGATRPFIIANTNGDILREIELNPFEVLTMEGHFQQLLRHGIPPQPHASGNRINFTFRWISRGFNL